MTNEEIRYGINPQNLLRTLPEVLRNDKKMQALAEGIAQELSDHLNNMSKLMIYVNIDTLPEDLLDILAYDFKVDWYDPDFSLEEKRRVMKESWVVHRTIGTKGAVARNVSAIFPGSTVKEWFQYEGDPYHFKLLIDETYGDDVQKIQRVLDRIKYYKNVRSVFDGIEYIVVIGYCSCYGAVAAAGMMIEFSVEVNVDGLG